MVFDSFVFVKWHLGKEWKRNIHFIRELAAQKEHYEKEILKS